MATIGEPEASNILDQIGRIQVQISNKISAASVSAEAATIRTKLDDLGTEVTALNNRMISAQATLNDLEARVRVLEDA